MKSRSLRHSSRSRPLKGLHEAVLHGLAGRDVVPFDLPILLPCQDGIRGQLGAIVRHDHAGVAAILGDDVEFAGDAFARDRVVDDGGQAFPAEVVDDAQDPEAAAVGERVGDEVEAPALVGILRDRHRCLYGRCSVKAPRDSPDAS